MAKFNVKLTSIELFSKKDLTKPVLKALDIASLKLHKELTSFVHKRYSYRNDLNKQRIRSKSSVKASKNLVRSGLAYRIQNSDLSKFGPTWRWGNINEGAKRQGRVHSITVLRGSRKVVRGKGNRGGFIPRNKSGTPIRSHKGGSQMYIRTSNKKYPLKLLYGPSTLNMVKVALRSRRVKSVIAAVDRDIVRLFNTL